MRVFIEESYPGRVTGWVVGAVGSIKLENSDGRSVSAILDRRRPDVEASLGVERANAFIAYQAYEMMDGLQETYLIVEFMDGEIVKQPVIWTSTNVIDRWDGYCYCCRSTTIFETNTSWLRDSLICVRCRSVVRERALARELSRLRPNWKTLSIHESSPANRGLSEQLRLNCPRYVPTHYFSSSPFGENINGYRNENIETQTFPDASFDIVITMDVMEHVFAPEAVYREIWRTLKDGGLYIHTFPIKKAQSEAQIARAVIGEGGAIEHILTPEIHGNPISGEGALVTFDYGYDIHQKIGEWAPFDVSISRYYSKTLGVLGECTEVIVCEKI